MPQSSSAVTLDNSEQTVVKRLASERIAHDRKVGAKATIYHGSHPMENEIDSLGAEFAYCKLMGCTPDTDPAHFQPFDARLSDGRTVDVKHTSRRNGRLLVKVKSRNSLPDLYALMIGKFPSYCLAGHITAKDMVIDSRIDFSLAHPAYAAIQADLSDLSSVYQPRGKRWPAPQDIRQLNAMTRQRERTGLCVVCSLPAGDMGGATCKAKPCISAFVLGHEEN